MLLSKFIVPLILLSFVTFGKILKETNVIDNKYIPLVLTGVGAFVGVLFFDDTDYVLSLAGLGGFSNNLHQIAKGFMVKEEQEHGEMHK